MSYERIMEIWGVSTLQEDKTSERIEVSPSTVPDDTDTRAFGEARRATCIRDIKGQYGNPLHRIYTAANLVTFARLLLVPLFLSVLLGGYSDFLAFAIFAVAASTDWVDGQLARRTNTVSELGKLLDPFVDRLLIVSGVLGLYLVGRLPLWVVITLMVRDFCMIAGFALLEAKGRKRIPVMYLGKVTTATILVGFSSLLANWPIIDGFGLFDSIWFPGFGAQPFALGIWFVYFGVIISIVTACIYVRNGIKALRGDSTQIL